MQVRKSYLFLFVLLVLLAAESHGMVSNIAFTLFHGIKNFIYERIKYFLPSRVMGRIHSQDYAVAIKTEYSNRQFYDQNLMEKKSMFKYLITHKKPLLVGLGGVLGALFGFEGPWLRHPVFSYFLFVLSIGLPTLRAHFVGKNSKVVFCSTLLYMPVDPMALQTELATMQGLQGEAEQLVLATGIDSQQESVVLEGGDQELPIVQSELPLPTASVSSKGRASVPFEAETVLFSKSYYFQILEHLWVSVLVLLFTWLSSSCMFGFLVMFQYYYARHYMIQNYHDNTVSFVQNLKFMTVWLWVIEFGLAYVIQACTGEDKDLYTYFTFDFIWQYFDLSEENPRCKTRFIGTTDVEKEKARAALNSESWIDIGVRTLFMTAIGALSAKTYAEYIEAQNVEWSSMTPRSLSSMVEETHEGVSSLALQSVPMPPFKKSFTRSNTGAALHHHRALSRARLEQLQSPVMVESAEADHLQHAKREQQLKDMEEERVRHEEQIVKEERERLEELERRDRLEKELQARERQRVLEEERLRVQIEEEAERLRLKEIEETRERQRLERERQEEREREEREREERSKTSFLGWMGGALLNKLTPSFDFDFEFE